MFPQNLLFQNIFTKSCFVGILESASLRARMSIEVRLLGVFMDRVPEPKGISVRVPKISGRTDGEPYPNRKLSGTQFRVPNNFGSGFWLPNYPIFMNLLFFINNFITYYPNFFVPFFWLPNNPILLPQTHTTSSHNNQISSTLHYQ